jgi:hypothetical protein
MEFFNNKENDILKFKINSDGIDINNIEPRLILVTKENKNILFIGEIDKDICRFNIPELNLYEKGDSGKIKFEIISEDLYFPVWEDKFEIKSKASVKIEEMISEIQQNTKSKPRISVSEAKSEPKPIESKIIKPTQKVVEKEETSTNNTLSKLESIFEKNNIPVIEEEEDKPIEKPKTNPIIRFDSFK